MGNESAFDADRLGQEQLKTAMALATARMKDSAESLEKIWTVLLICGVGGVVLVYDIADLKSVICKYLSNDDKCTVRSAAPIFLALVIYYFVKFGQNITSFLEARKLHDRLLALHFGKEQSAADLLRPIRESTSFFEGFYSRDALHSKIMQFAYFFTAILVLASGQASALLLIYQGYGASTWPNIAVAACALGLGVLYLGFWKSKHEHPYAKAAVLLSVAGIVILFLLFQLTAPNPQATQINPKCLATQQ